VARPVSAFDARLRTLAADMLQTMYESGGIGLAATQIDVHERLIVMDITEERNQPLVIVNPEIVWHSEASKLNEEGCLSVPAVYDRVDRGESVHVRVWDEHGAQRTIEAQDVMAICIQHEMDHLLGKVFVEYLSPLKRDRIKKKMRKARREDAH
jgi:peptide deformylase